MYFYAILYGDVCMYVYVKLFHTRQISVYHKYAPIKHFYLHAWTIVKLRVTSSLLHTQLAYVHANT